MVKATEKPFEELTDEDIANHSTPAKGREVAIRTSDGNMATLPADELKALSFNDIASHFGVTTADEAIGTDQYGPILEDKGRLVGVPFLLVHWEFHNGDHGEFVSMWVLTPDNDRYIVNDGSTGIKDQLRALTDESGTTGMVACKHGFRASNYTYTGPDGKDRPATTYYIDTKL